MKLKTILSLIFLFVLISCNKSNSYSKFDEFQENNHRWDKSIKKVYDFTIDDDTQLYDITFKFSHVYDYQFNSVPIDFSIESPNGKKENFTIDLTIKDESGKQLADCIGDVCDLVYKIKEKDKLIKGLYKVTISHSFKGPYLPNVIGIGLNVEKVK